MQEQGDETNKSMPMRDLTILIPTMGKPSLGACLKYYLAIAEITSIVVVDFSPQISHAMESFQGIDGQVDVVEVIGQHYFNKSAAINLGFGQVMTECFIVCDADVLIEHSTIKNWAASAAPAQLLSLEQVSESDGSGKRAGPGICCCAVGDFSRLGGYSSDYVGWGFEDHDFIWRAQKIGIAHKASGNGIHLSHDDVERTRYYRSHDKHFMRHTNKLRFELRCVQEQMFGTLCSDVKRYPHRVRTQTG